MEDKAFIENVRRGRYNGQKFFYAKK